MSNFNIVKFGSEVLTNSRGLDVEAINRYCYTMTREAESGLVVVTSGAVATGRLLYADHETLRIDAVMEMDSPRDLAMFSMLGSAAVNMAWQDGFALQNILTGSLAVTHNEIDSPEGCKLEENIKHNAENGVVTVINEADALSDSELMALLCCADNDGLAAHLAVRLSAINLIIITDDGGVLDVLGETVVKEVNPDNASDVFKAVYERQKQNAKKNSAGRGGMLSKLQSTASASRAGVENVMIASPAGLHAGFVNLADHAQTTTVEL